MFKIKFKIAKGENVEPFNLTLWKHKKYNKYSIAFQILFSQSILLCL